MSLPPPLNFFLLFAAPYVISTTNQEKLNQRMLWIAYLPVLVCVTLLFALGEVVMWPFVYVKLIFHKLTMTWVYSKSFRVSRADKFSNFLFFFFAGPLIIASNSVVDVYFFVRHLTLLDLKKIKHKTRHQELSKDSLRILQSYFSQKQEKLIAFSRVATHLRSDMRILELVQKAVMPKVNVLSAEK